MPTSPRVDALRETLLRFMDERVYPAEKPFEEALASQASRIAISSPCFRTENRTVSLRPSDAVQLACQKRYSVPFAPR